MRPQFSIVVPVYNPGEYLPRCLDALAAQTFTGWECLLVDDGSTDDSGAVCDAYAARDPRFTVFHQKNAGASAARNQGIDAAQAPWLLFVDADDVLAPCALEQLAQLQAENPNSFLFFAFTEDLSCITSSTQPVSLSRYTAVDVGRLYSEAPFPTPWGKLFQTDLLHKAGLCFDTSLKCYEDRPFMAEYLRAFFRSQPMGECLFLRQALYYYENGNPQSLSKYDRSVLAPAYYKMFDQLLTDCLNTYHTPPLELSLIVLEYLNTLLYGAWCTSPPQRRAVMAVFYKSAEYQRLLGYFSHNRLYEVRCLALRFRLTQLAIALDQSRLSEKKWLYWKLSWLGQRLFCRGWQSLL